LLFCGLLSYRPNQEAVRLLVEEIMPLVWRHSPQTRLVIAGAHPGPELSRLTDSDPRLEVVANPGDMGAIADECSLLVVPLRLGSGTRVKILQALAWGLPVITTALGCEGLEVQEGSHLLVRESCEEIAQAILTLEQEPSKWDSLRREGRRRIEERYSWTGIWAALEEELLFEVQGGRKCW
jgi:glycosyltransferase involved in cell wall biosynthesis